MDKENEPTTTEQQDALTPLRRRTTSGSSIRDSYISLSSRIQSSPSIRSKSLKHPRSPSLLSSPNQGLVIDRRNYNSLTTLNSLSSNAENIVKIDMGGIYRAPSSKNLDNDDNSDNNDNDDIATSLAKALETNTTVTELNLPGNGIQSHPGAKAFANMLRLNKTLQRLYLNDNCIDTQGAITLCKALKVNTTLVYLGLRRNEIEKDTDALKQIECYLARNGVMKEHAANVAVIGPSYYISIVEQHEEREQHQQLLWTDRAWEACVADGKGLRLVHLALEDVISAANNTEEDENGIEGRGCQKKLFADSASDTLPQSKELFDLVCNNKENCNKFLKQLVDNSTDSEGGTMLHVAASLESHEASEFCRFLVEQLRIDIDTVKDKSGRSVRDVASCNKYLRSWAKIVKEGIVPSPQKSNNRSTSMMEEDLFLGRYKVEDGPPLYQSSSYKVQFALDTNPWKQEETGDDEEEHQFVTLKVFSDRHAFDRELYSRLSMEQNGNVLASGNDIPKERNLFFDDDDENNHVVNILRYHDDDVLDDSSNNERMYCIVTPRGEYNLSHMLLYDGGNNNNNVVPQRDLVEISRIAVDVASALKQLHKEEVSGGESSGSTGGIVHADVRPQNILFMDGKYKLVGFTSAVNEGELIRNERVESTAFCPPEFAKHLFHSMKGNEDEESPHKLKDDRLVAHGSFDVWSYGVVMYHLLTGEALFSHDGEDNLSDQSNQVQLINWDGLSQSQLDKVLQGYNEVANADQIISNAKDFLSKCLMANPDDRFHAMSDVLSHPFLCKEDHDKESPNIILHESAIEMVVCAADEEELSQRNVRPTCFIIVPYKLQWDETLGRLVLPSNASEYTQLTFDLQQWSVLRTILTTLQKEEESAYREMVASLQQTASTDMVKAAKDFMSYAGIISENNAFLGVQEKIQNTTASFFDDPIKCLSQELIERRIRWLKAYNNTQNGFFYLIDELNRIPVEDDDAEEEGVYPIAVEKDSKHHQKLLPYMQLSSFNMICVVASITNDTNEIYSCLTEKTQDIILRASTESHFAGINMQLESESENNNLDGGEDKESKLFGAQQMQELNNFFEKYDKNHTYSGLCCVTDNKGSSLWSTKEMKEYLNRELQPLDMWRENISTKKELQQTKNKLQRTQEKLEQTEKELETTKELLKKEESSGTELQERVRTLEADIKRHKATSAKNDVRGNDATQPSPQVDQSTCCILM